MTLGISATVWYGLGTAVLGAAMYDANNNAQHQARVQTDLQNRQMEDADRIAREEREMTERINQQNLAAQRAAHAASLAAAARQAAESRAQMERQLKMADEAKNRANQKTPNTRQILSEAEQAGRSGVSGTMLTGPQGVSNDQLTLGRSTLLGA